MISNKDMLILLEHKLRELVDDRDTMYELQKFVINAIEELGKEYRHNEEWIKLKKILNEMKMYF